MTRVRQFVLVALASSLLSVSLTVSAQQAAAPAAPLSLHAVLVLTHDFCASQFKQGSMWTTGREKLQVGKAACADLPDALKPVFAALTVATTPPTSGDAQVVLIPKFANAHATTSAWAFSNREMDVFLTWTVTDGAGKTIWLHTVQGKSKHHMGNAFTHYHDVNLIVRDSVKDAVAQSASSIEAAPELLKLAGSGTAAAK
jgi:hypothetical protein